MIEKIAVTLLIIISTYLIIVGCYGGGNENRT